MAVKMWSSTQDNFVKVNYHRGVKYCADMLDRTEKAVEQRFYHLGVWSQNKNPSRKPKPTKPPHK